VSAAGVDVSFAAAQLSAAAKAGIDEDMHATPAGVFAQTTRPDRLLHYVIDALEHSRH
jgi:hypothetical protein